jgi:hypothetical protein
MIYQTPTQITFAVPLTQKAHGLAQQAYQRYRQPAKAKQVYLNVLAAYATDYYLSCLGFATDLQNSDSQNPIFQALNDTGALQVCDWGVLECRPVLPQEDTCYIPPEVQQARRGYVAVALNAELTEATLLGFFEQVQQEKMPLSQLASLEVLIEFLHAPEQDITSMSEPPTVHLNRWLEDVIDVGWQALDRLFAPSPQFAFRSTRQAEIVKRGKLLQLQGLEESIALIVGIQPRQETEMDISVEVAPSKGHGNLPDDVRVEVLDATGEAVMEAVTRTMHKLALEFSGESGEQFTIKVAFGEASTSQVFSL